MVQYNKYYGVKNISGIEVYEEHLMTCSILRLCEVGLEIDLSLLT